MAADSRLTTDNLNVDRTQYKISLIPLVSSLSSSRASTPVPLRYPLGTPIHITWTAPSTHSSKDWIGIYRVIDLDDRDVTKLASRGKWLPICRAEYDDGRSDAIIAHDETRTGASGELVFSGNVLVWKCGVYEARYHHDGYFQRHS
jgi:phosphatidylethanolamine N-methyltransferase